MLITLISKEYTKSSSNTTGRNLLFVFMVNNECSILLYLEQL